jgi:hypothetical protein
MTIYLYVKTHRKTGLKYLGKTEKSDPHAYKGSGKYWINHIKNHGYDVETEIIRECQTHAELKEWGLYYTNLWNVVESDEWANLKEECGDGNTHNDAKKMWDNRDYRERSSLERKRRWDNNDAYRNNHYNILTKQWDDPLRREEQRKVANTLWEDIEHRKIMSEKHSGSKNGRFDHRIHHFIHDDGVEEKMTRYDFLKKYMLNKGCVSELISGKCSKYKGWQIKKD